MNKLSLSSLGDDPPVSIEEGLKRARRLVSNRVGIISEVQFEEIPPGYPNVHWASSHPANAEVFAGQRALNHGMAASVDPARATMKAIGESVERYCAAQYDMSQLKLASYADLGTNAVDPREFALFSAGQYADYVPLGIDQLRLCDLAFGRGKQPTGFHFSSLTADTKLRWVGAYSLSNDKPSYVPAAFVYIPYRFDVPNEPVVWNLISTGLACGPTLASAMYKGFLELIERDAIMIVWHNRLKCPHIDFASVDEPLAIRLLTALESVPVHCHAVVMNLDFEVNVVMVLLQSATEFPPFSIIGAGADLEPQRALALALEEVCLSFCGIGRHISRLGEYRPRPDFSDLVTLELHAVAHALVPELRPTVEFLAQPSHLISVKDLPNFYTGSQNRDLTTIIKQISSRHLEALAVDLTTDDIDDAGFKVVRAAVPGLQPLDLNHMQRHLGGRRIYEVPFHIGRRSRPITEAELNSDPHPFP